MAGLTTTQTFSDGDTVTAAKLNNIIANCSIDASAVTTVKINDGDVTLAKMATASVDTGQLVDDAVQNSKLENMGGRTVKANATNASVNPTDVSLGGNKLLAGTTDSINAVSFTTDLEMDASDSAATLIRAAASLVGGKSSVTAAATDEILIKDATDGALKKVTAKTVVQSFDATTSESGAVSLATAAEIIDPTTIVAAADAVGAAVGAPMLAKAWGYLKTSGGSIAAGSILQNCTVSRTGTGAFTVLFDPTDVPSVKYMVMGNGREELSSAGDPYGYGLHVVSSSLATTGFNFVTVDTDGDQGTLRDPDGGVQFIVYGLTS
ncbi:tail fiber protein [uncultured Mediterranean phage uvDeep-CGR2-AD12-C183]|nr:tail fiber protein [uncultured Mediterranean phage uvDeep-CGR2-AD12-C183]